MYLVSSGFSFKPTSSSSSSSSTQFSQEWARRKVVVKHSIKSKSNWTSHLSFSLCNMKLDIWMTCQRWSCELMIRKKLMGRNFAPTTAAMAGSTNQSLGVYYGSISLFTSILQNIFLLYHVETFVSIYKIDKMSFWIGEAIFLIWNSFNDPLFGWLSDRDILTSAKGTSSENVITRRIKALQVAGPLLGISFMAFWASWTYSSIQFVICLCLYDGFLTMIDLHHSALLADLAISTESRTKLNYYSTIFSALGASSVFLSYIFWDRSNWLKFQLFCLFLAVVSVLGYLYSTQALRRLCGTLHGHQHSQDIRLVPFI